MSITGITIIGAGRVGGALARALFRRGYPVDMILSASMESARRVASVTDAGYGTGYDIPETSSVVIIAVPDRMIESVAASLKIKEDTVVLHTAGSYGLEVFPADHKFSAGVLYPMQTFSEQREPDIMSVPFFAEGEDQESINVIGELAGSLSGRLFMMDTRGRRYLHLAAVFACNFVNHMLDAAGEIAGDAGVDVRVFESLVRETVDKAFTIGPGAAQTGPAVRNDAITIEKHMNLLSEREMAAEVYDVVTRSIIERKIKRDNE
jgi:predicted short-subunit dehydrogenase-like oxidoreductase (DUF2520 family)